jgi:hypothetical protein
MWIREKHGGWESWADWDWYQITLEQLSEIREAIAHNDIGDPFIDKPVWNEILRLRD